MYSIYEYIYIHMLYTYTVCHYSKTSSITPSVNTSSASTPFATTLSVTAPSVNSPSSGPAVRDKLRRLQRRAAPRCPFYGCSTVSSPILCHAFPPCLHVIPFHTVLCRAFPLTHHSLGRRPPCHSPPSLSNPMSSVVTPFTIVTLFISASYILIKDDVLLDQHRRVFVVLWVWCVLPLEAGVPEFDTGYTFTAFPVFQGEWLRIQFGGL
jgi:hypothetical protein